MDSIRHPYAAMVGLLAQGMDTGIMAEPMLQVWLQESFEPTPSEGEWYAWDPYGHEGPQRPGRWVSETSRPPATARSQCFYFDRDRLDVSRGAQMAVRFTGTLLCGQDAGAWCAYRNLADLPVDERLEDGASLCLTTEPLRERLETVEASRIGGERGSCQEGTESTGSGEGPP